MSHHPKNHLDQECNKHACNNAFYYFIFILQYSYVDIDLHCITFIVHFWQCLSIIKRESRIETWCFTCSQYKTSQLLFKNFDQHSQHERCNWHQNSNKHRITLQTPTFDEVYLSHNNSNINDPQHGQVPIIEL